MMRTIAWTSAVALVLLTTSASADPEERCLDLNRQCVCSETLDTNQSIPKKIHVNPNNSTNKECSGEPGDGRSVYLTQGGTTPIESHMPSGNRVSRVWANTGPGVAHVIGNIDAVTSSTRRHCARVYFRFSDDYSLTATHTCEPDNPAYPDCCERNKLMRVSGPWGSLQIEDYNDRFRATWIVTDENGNAIRDFNLPRSGPRFGVSDCRDTWCRVEGCIGGDLLSGKGIYPEVRFVRINSGQTTFSYDPGGPVDGAGKGGFEKVWIADMFRQRNVNSQGTMCRGTRFFSHAMQAAFDTDNKQWIGPAFEVEGGTGTGPDPDPDVEPLGQPGTPFLVE